VAAPNPEPIKSSAVTHGAACWIWAPCYDHVNQHVCFRKRIELPAAPLSARIRVTADTRYRLFVNGACLLRGPARGFPHAVPADELDLAPFLRPGLNVLAAHVLSFGVSTAQNVFRGRAGFFLEGLAACEGGAQVELHTGPTWCCTEAACYSRHAGRCGPQLGYQEHYDAAQSLVGRLGKSPHEDWASLAYNDSAWEAPQVLGAPGILPWSAIVERGIPLLETRLQPPLRIVGQWEGVAQAGGLRRKPEACAAPAAKPFFEQAELLCQTAPQPVKLRRVPAGKSAALLLDFGETRYGYPVLKVAEAAGGEVFDLLYGEEAGPSGLLLCPPTTPADRLICRPGRNCFETLQARGCRYVMLVARNVRRPLSVEQVALVETGYPAPQRGSFACSDARLNAIWETGVRTLRHCMADTFLDCPAKAQQQDWAAVRIAGLACFHALGDSALYRRALRLMSQSLLPEGLLFGVAPSEQPECLFLDYGLHWVASLDEYYQFTGDLETLREHRPTLEKVLGFFAILAGERGLLWPPPRYSLFLDSEPAMDRANLIATFDLLYLHALNHAAAIARALGDSGLASHCSRQAAALDDRIRMIFSSRSFSLLVEAVDLHTGEPSEKVSQQAIALAVLENVLGRRESDRTGPAAQVLCDFLPPDGCAAASGPVRANLFFRAFVHEALVRLGCAEEALQDIRRTWGYMLDQGATTWWERLPLLPGSGRCHAWSVHPTTFLSRHVLGLSPLEPGWKRFLVAPLPLGLEYAQGKVPTPQGDIEIHWRLPAPDQPLQIDELTVPPGTIAQLSAADGQPPRELGPGTHRLVLGN